MGLLAVPAERDFNFPLECKLERVRKEVEKDLLPHVVIDEDRLFERLDGDLVAQAGALDGGFESARHVTRQDRQIGGLVGSLDTAGFDTGEVEEGVDELEQPKPV